MGVGGGAEGETLQADSGLSAEPAPGLNPTTHENVTGAEIKSRWLHRRSHPGAPVVEIDHLKMIVSL